MAATSTIQFLPEIFRTQPNQKFLGATVDQLVSPGAVSKVNGFIGRTFAPTYKNGDNYVPETTSDRAHYQLEAGAVVKNKQTGNVDFATNYIDLLQNIKNQGGYSFNQDRLFENQSYSYDGHIDYDKFVNFKNYYWMPNGPDAVNVFADTIPYTADYTVNRVSAVNGYNFSGYKTQINPQLYLARGGTYTFDVNQSGNGFWIQTELGTSGTKSAQPNVSTRNVLGVDNNGASSGTITFAVPQKNAQDFYINMVQAGTADFAVDFHYTDIQGQLLSTFLTNFPSGLDGFNSTLNTQWNNKTIVFVNSDIDPVFWTYNNVTVNPAVRRSIWKIQLVPAGTDYTINLVQSTAVQVQQSVFLRSGTNYGGESFWLNGNQIFQLIPGISANLDVLYYQDATNPDFVGIIHIVDNVSNVLNVDTDIVGKATYTSHNGVTFTNGLKVTFDSTANPASYAGNTYYVEGVGSAIRLINVTDMIVPEAFGTQIATTPDYITINRGSIDLNPWTRSNRWFHVDVINAAASYNGTATNFGPGIRGSRPIIEFEADLQLINFGRQSDHSLDILEFTPTDAFVQIEGQTAATLDTVNLQTGQTVIFAQDLDVNVANKIYTVTVIDVNNTNYINLQLVDNPVVQPNQCILVKQGSSAGKTFWYDGTTWHLSQAKTALNQYPLFDIFDKDGISFTNTSFYPATTFSGTEVFTYQTGTGANDSILGFPLSYQNFNNIGDIVFESKYDTDTFTYTSNQATISLPINSGYLAKNKTLSNRQYLNNWTPIVEQSKQYQIISVIYTGASKFIKLDVLPDNATTIPYIKVYLNNVLLSSSDYTIVYLGVSPVLEITSTLTVNDKIDVLIYTSTGVSSLGYYQVPDNLDLNALNESFTSITLGQLRNHYNKLIENTSVGPYGLPPLQDANFKSQGGTLLQNSSPAIYSMLFLNNPDINFINSINLARKEYSKFKNKFLELSSSLTGLDYSDPVGSVDKILQTINAVKNKSFSWYYSDMVPQGGAYTAITYNVVNAEQNFYEISSIFNDTVPSGRAVLVYHNGVQLTKGADYVFNQTRPSIDLNITLSVGDTLVIRDYASTDGNYIPETPTKLGMYPAFLPEIYTDTTYINDTTVIVGHDGSTTPVFGDFRDSFLLELEKRIYNNLKMSYDNNSFNMYDVIPGRFRNTRYTFAEFNQILTQSFLQWIGNNSINFTDNIWFDANNAFTWNFVQFIDKLSSQPLQGSWRAVYNYWYDTDQPHLTPWKMLGFGSEPSWWQDRYGPAPYTGSNTLLWTELSEGYVWNNGTPYTDKRFVRPQLLSVIPVDDYGTLLSPNEFMVKGYISVTENLNYSVGQQGPTETAWRRSSDFPYAMQIALALTNPGRYFGTQIDLSMFKTNSLTGQVSDDMNQRIRPTNINVNGESLSDGTTARTSGYINWVGDYIKNFGIDPVTKLNNIFDNLNVNLLYKVAGFTDKSFINILAEQTSPGSTNSSIIIPQENYNIYLNDSVPLGTATYSAVIVERTSIGYVVSGYDLANPYFTILPSIVNNNSYNLKFGNLQTKINKDYSKIPMQIAYGTEFTTAQQLCDFLVSYQRYLEALGFTFTDQDNDLGTQRDWFLSIKEFLVWVQQGWGAGNILVMSPINDHLQLQSIQCVVGEIVNSPTGSRILDQNFNVITDVDFTVSRYDNPSVGNSFSLTTLNNKVICFAKLELVQTEHVMIFDNTDVFNDIIYVPSQGSRQYRLKLVGSKTGNWTGALSAGGFVYSNPQINAWQPGKDFRQGDIVTFNNNYYTAPSDIPATTQFNISSWSAINATDIQTGLLPGFSYNAEKFENIYDVDRPPVSKQDQEFSAGLIGFRERSYLTDLGISLQNQVKFYQGFIKQKGTLNAVTALTNASFNNTGGNVNVYEEWAFRVGTYGGTASNPFVEFVVDDINFNSNPSAFTFTSNAASVVSQISVPYTSANLYNSSGSNISTQMFADRTSEQYVGDIPFAGYMNLADVDYSVYDLSTYHTISANVGRGDIIWTAKSTTGSWDVFRVTESRVNVSSLKFKLDNQATVTFTDNPTLNVNDIFVIKGLSSQFDGFYQVASIVGPQQLTVYVQSNLQALVKAGTVSGNGIAYKLQSVHLSHITDLVNITPPDGWQSGDTIWVDNATANGWGTYQYTTEWNSAVPQINSLITPVNEQFGLAVQFANISPTSNVAVIGDATGRIQFASGTNYANIAQPTMVSTMLQPVTSIDTSGYAVAAGCGGNITVSGYVDIYNIATNSQFARLANASPTAGDGFGTSVSYAYDVARAYTLAVGVPGKNLVQLYSQPTPSSTPVLSGTIVGTGNNFGQFVKLSNDSNRLLVGATAFSDSYINVGEVSLYTRIGSTFTLTQVIKAPNEAIVTAFGTALNVDALAHNLYISASANTAGGMYLGHVYRYIDTGNTTGTIVGTAQNPTVGSSSSIAINGTTIALSSGNLASVISAINNAYIPGVVASNVNNYLQVTSAQTVASPLTIIPLTGTAYNDLGLTTYTFSQMLSQPGNNVEGFGTALAVSSDASTLAVSSTGARTTEQTTFDGKHTTFDVHGTHFVDNIINSGAVYVYQLLTSSINPIGTYIYGQELSPGNLSFGDMFGQSIDMLGNQILVGAPGDDQPTTNNGGAYIFSNPNMTPIWNLVRQQQNTVDINSINRVFLFNKTTNAMLSQLDYYDPAKGKLLQQFDQDIDYKTVYDPAFYNAGTNPSAGQYIWGPEQVGKIWWNLDTIRFINYEQDSIDYRLLNWGTQFPGSTVNVYEWVESTALPSKYAGDGTPVFADDSAYATYGFVNPQTNTVNIKYYFWVQHKNTVATSANKLNSVYTIAEAIQNPGSVGLPYMAAVRDDTVALFNVNKLLTGRNTVLHVNTKSDNDTNVIHSEYQLVQEGNPDSELPTHIVSKFIDSIAGIDASGNIVPDPTLPVSQAYGINIRPRQSIFVNINTAINNILNFTNTVLSKYPVVETKNLTRMKSQEPIPSVRSGNYQTTVTTYTELSYIDTNLYTVALVTTDVNNFGKWAIYTYSGGVWTATLVQSYNTGLYWNYTDWYDSSFDPTTTIDFTVSAELDVAKLTLSSGQFIKVLDSGNGNFVIYRVNSDLSLIEVGIQNGTISITNPNIPGLELRNILTSLIYDIFVDDLAIKANQIFFSLIKYILAEQGNVDWAFKTSFLSAKQQLRKLQQTPLYIPDNQGYYLDYINEVAPYRSVIREFIVDYLGNDEYGSDISDFDLPSYYDANVGYYRSPDNTLSSDATLLSTSGKYRQWYNNYTYSVVSVIVENGGTGYVLPPSVTITGGGGTGATAVSSIDSYGRVDAITITNPGHGYTSDPTIVLNGTGSGAMAYPVLRNVYSVGDANNGHNVVRSVNTTLRFDRTTYAPVGNIINWDTITTTSLGTTFPTGSLFYYQGQIYQANVSYTLGSYTFDVSNVAVYNPANFNNAADRISAYYQPDNTAIDYDSLMSGISYPGVQVQGAAYNLYTNNFSSNLVYFWANTSSLYSSNTAALDFTTLGLVPQTPADFGTVLRVTGSAHNNNNFYVAEVMPSTVILGLTQVHDEPIGANVTFKWLDITKSGQVDSIVQNFYTANVGINPEDIIIDGGKYYDTYSSHAPEELVPGIMFDNLNMSVYTGLFANTQTIAYRVEHTMGTDPATHQVITLSNAITSNVGDFFYQLNANCRVLANTTTNTVVVGFYGDTNSNVTINSANISINGIAQNSHVVNVQTPSWPKYYKIDPAATSTLTANLNITDANIHVANAAVFGAPNPQFAVPGVVYIDGEKITYYVRDTVNNVLGQIRRAVDGTGAPVMHTIGTNVVETNVEQVIPGGYQVHTTTWLNPPPNYSAIVGDQAGDQITDGTGNVIVTVQPSSVGITDGSGFQGATTAQVKFLRGIS